MNRTQTVINGVTNIYTLAQTGDQLASWGVNGENTLTFDTAGNVTQIDLDGQTARDLDWDIQYRLTEVSEGGTPIESYQYDPTGRRIKTVNASGTTLHVYDGAHVVADLDSAGNMIRSYTWGPGIDNLLAMTVHGSTETNSYYALKDHLGSVLALADENGNIAESYEYDAWGNVLKIRDGSGNVLSQSAVGNRYMWQGREYDNTTGLYYFRARWYDPVTGRWFSKDPIGISGGLNQYVFCGNNPVNFVDPWGLCADDVKTTSISIFGANIALTLAALFDISFLRDSYGDKAIAIKLGVGVGVEGKGKLPGTSVGRSEGGVRDQRGIGEQSNIGVGAAITIDKDSKKISGIGIGGVGGGHYWTYTFVLPFR